MPLIESMGNDSFYIFCYFIASVQKGGSQIEMALFCFRGGGVALVKFNFGGSKSQQFIFPWFSHVWRCRRPLGALIFEFRCVYQIIRITQRRHQIIFGNIILGNPDFQKSVNSEESRSGASLRSAVLENLEDGMEIVHKIWIANLAIFNY